MRLHFKRFFVNSTALIGFLTCSSMLYAVTCPPERTITLRSTKATTVDARQSYVAGSGNGAVNPTLFQPGDAICIVGNSSGTNASLRIYNMSDIPGIHSGAPITFINANGQVVFNGGGEAGIILANSRYVRVTGTGDANHEYGFVINGSVNAYNKGLYAWKQSGDFEWDHIEITSLPGEGVVVKASSDCSDASVPAKLDSSGPYTDAWGKRVKPLSWSNLHDYNRDGLINEADVVTQENGTLHNIHIHHLHIQNTSNEGMYLGDNRVFPFYAPNPDPNGDPHLNPGTAMGKRTICQYFDDSTTPWTVIANGENDPLNAKIVGLDVHDNRIENTGWDSINIKSAATDCFLHDNIITNHTVNGTKDQRGGFSLQPGTGCHIMRNRVMAGAGSGIFSQGSGGTIANNIIVRSGQNGTPGEQQAAAIALDSSSYANADLYVGTHFSVLNNTLVSPLSYGIYFSVEYGSHHSIANNLVLNVQSPDPGGKAKDIYVSSAAAPTLTTKANNYYDDNLLGSTELCDPVADDFHLTALSIPLIDDGMDPSGLTGVFLPALQQDADGLDRPVGLGYDVGAYEFYLGASCTFN